MVVEEREVHHPSMLYCVNLLRKKDPIAKTRTTACSSIVCTVLLPRDEPRCEPKRVVLRLVSAVASVDGHRSVGNRFRRQCKWPKSAYHLAQCNWTGLARTRPDLARHISVHPAPLQIYRFLCRNWNTEENWIILLSVDRESVRRDRCLGKLLGK